MKYEYEISSNFSVTQEIYTQYKIITDIFLFTDLLNPGLNTA